MWNGNKNTAGVSDFDGRFRACDDGLRVMLPRDSGAQAHGGNKLRSTALAGTLRARTKVSGHGRRYVRPPILY